MLSRRRVLRGGLGALATVLTPGARRLACGGPPLFAPIDGSNRGSAPLVQLPRGLRSMRIDGLPFHRGMTGDPFPHPHLRFFPSPAMWLENGEPPPPTEEVEVATVGGGISGLATGYLLRDHEPVIFELNDRFGGSARGETWRDASYPMGGAYVITPDPGTFLDDIYRELDLHVDHRLDAGASQVSLSGRLLAEEFWSGTGLDVPDLRPFERYAEVVQYMANVAYPEIPLPDGPAADAVIALDRKSFLQDIEDQMGMPMPPLLAAGVQAYCYSSFGAGTEEISAAAGWNFLAAEEFGRWVFDGGNAQMAQRFWRAIAEREHSGYSALRSGALVVDVRLQPRGVQVTWADTNDGLHSLLAKRVVMACPKNVVRRVLQDVQRLDPVKAAAMERVHHTGYIVANVLLDAPVDLDFYDIFLLGDGSFPTNQGEAEMSRRVVDITPQLGGRIAVRLKDRAGSEAQWFASC